LGSALARRNFKVLLVDLDPQANATGNFGIEKESNIMHVGNLMLGFSEDVATAPKTKDYVINSQEMGMDIIPAAHEMTKKEKEILSESINFKFLREALMQVDSEYDFILLDCPPSLSAFTTKRAHCG
jgi:chromosome partitioning protein